MRWILFFFSVPIFFFGVGDYLAATTIWQQILGSMIGLAGVILFCAAGIIDAIVTMQKKLEATASNKEEDNTKLPEEHVKMKGEI